MKSSKFLLIILCLLVVISSCEKQTTSELTKENIVQKAEKRDGKLFDCGDTDVNYHIKVAETSPNETIISYVENPNNSPSFKLNSVSWVVEDLNTGNISTRNSTEIAVDPSSSFRIIASVEYTENGRTVKEDVGFFYAKGNTGPVFTNVANNIILQPYENAIAIIMPCHCCT